MIAFISSELRIPFFVVEHWTRWQIKKQFKYLMAITDIKNEAMKQNGEV